MGWFEEVMVETPEEREFFATALAGQSEWHAEEALRIAQLREELAANVYAQAYAPEGRYAFEFDKDGFDHLTPYATYVFDEDGDYDNLIRIKAATRRL